MSQSISHADTVSYIYQRKTCVFMSKAEKAPNTVVILKFCKQLTSTLGQWASTEHCQSSSHPVLAHIVFLWLNIQPRNLEAFALSPTSTAQSQIQFLPSERKAVLQSGQWYPGCWARSFEFHFAVGAGPQRCQEALSSLGHHRGAGPTVVHAEKWSYSGSVGNIQSSVSFPSNSLTFSSRIFLAVTKRGKKVYQI